MQHRVFPLGDYSSFSVLKASGSGHEYEFYNAFVGDCCTAGCMAVMYNTTMYLCALSQEPKPRHVSVKEVVLPFNKFPGADTLLGPEMRSTGEVMGIDYDFASSYAKAQIAAGQKLPMSGKVFISMADKYKADAVGLAKQLTDMGYQVVATRGTAQAIMSSGIKCESIFKISEGRPNPADYLKNGDITLMMITSGGDEPDLRDGKDLRRLALTLQVG